MRDDYVVYFGTNTSKNSQGIYYSTFNIRTGLLSKTKLAYEINNPTYQYISKKK